MSKFPYSDEAGIILDDGTKMVVVEKHHASPIERWQMWNLLNAVANELETTRRKRLKLRLMFLVTVFSPNCQACRYEVRPGETSG